MKLDRATLLSSYGVLGGNKASGWECEVCTSQTAFQQLMEAKQVQIQAEIDDEMSNKKI